MDPGVLDEVNNGLVALLILVTEVLSQVDEQLSAYCLVAVHVGDVLKLRFTCREPKTDGLILCVETHNAQIIKYFHPKLKIKNHINLN